MMRLAEARRIDVGGLIFVRVVVPLPETQLRIGIPLSEAPAPDLFQRFSVLVRQLVESPRLVLLRVIIAAPMFVMLVTAMFVTAMLVPLFMVVLVPMFVVVMLVPLLIVMLATAISVVQAVSVLGFPCLVSLLPLLMVGRVEAELVDLR